MHSKQPNVHTSVRKFKTYVHAPPPGHSKWALSGGRETMAMGNIHYHRLHQAQLAGKISCEKSCVDHVQKWIENKTV